MTIAFCDHQSSFVDSTVINCIPRFIVNYCHEPLSLLTAASSGLSKCLSVPGVSGAAEIPKPWPSLEWGEASRLAVCIVGALLRPVSTVDSSIELGSLTRGAVNESSRPLSTPAASRIW